MEEDLSFARLRVFNCIAAPIARDCRHTRLWPQSRPAACVARHTHPVIRSIRHCCALVGLTFPIEAEEPRMKIPIPQEVFAMKTLNECASSGNALVVPDRILVATDLTDADYLVPHAIAQARACGAALTFVHVIPPGEALSLDARAIPYENSATMAQEARQALENIGQGIRDAGIQCDVRVVSGFPRDQIAAVAREIGAGRILAGTHGRRHLRRFFLGSVVHEILRSSEIPIFTVGPCAREASSFGAPRKILHPVSLAAGFEHSARIALEVARFYRADIVLLHVLSPAVLDQSDPNRILEWTKSALLRVVSDEAIRSSRVTVQVEIGDAVDQVLNIDAEMSADLIILGVNSDATFWPVRGDDTVYKVIASARSPVLSIRNAPAPAQAAAPVQ
jgi:nucleotide-binding universal stress UspA family protein